MATTPNVSTATTTAPTYQNVRPAFGLRGGHTTSRPSIYEPATEEDDINHEYNRTPADWASERAEDEAMRAFWHALNTPEMLQQRRLGAWVPVMEFLLQTAARAQMPRVEGTAFVGMPEGYMFYGLEEEEEEDDMFDYSRGEGDEDADGSESSDSGYDSEEESDEENHCCLHHHDGTGYRGYRGSGMRGGAA